MDSYLLDKKALKKGWGSTEQYWFSLNSYRIVDYKDLSALDIPQGESQSTYFLSLGYIPYFFVSNEEVIKSFIDSVEEKKLKEALSKIDENDYVNSFWKYVNVYPSLAEKYSDFEDSYILSKAIAWCDENSIKYELQK
ncbi:MAG: hypothetical protein ACI4IL_04765 [Eubacterium sp.]